MPLFQPFRAAILAIVIAFAPACSDDEPYISQDAAATDFSSDARGSDGHPIDLGDAGPATDMTSSDIGNHGDSSLAACNEFTSAVGRSLTVTYGTESIDFSTGAFDSDFNDDVANGERYWYFIFKSADGKYGLELRLAPGAVPCPETFQLPVSDQLVLIFFESATFTEIAASGYAGSSGALTIEGYITTSAHKELAFQCADCVLAPVPSSLYPAVTVNGGVRQSK